MAYVPQQLPEDEKNQFGRTGQTTPQPVPPQGGGSAGSGTNAAPGQATSTQFGSNAAKLSDYLSANKDQVSQFGQQVAGNLNQTYGNTMNAIDSGFGSFNQQIGQGYTPNNTDLTSKAAANPTDFAKDPNNISGFKSLYNDQYTGPTSFESSPVYQDLNSQVNKAVSDAGMTGSFSGLQSYLANNMGTANNTAGMQTLDTALLQRSPEASQAIQQAATPFQNLTSYLGGKANTLDTNIANAKSDASNISSGLQNQFAGTTGFIPTLQNDLTNRLQQTQGTQGQNAQRALLDFQQGTATPDDLKLLGFNLNDLGDKALSNSWQTGQALTKDYGVPIDWNAYFTQQNPSVVYSSPGTVATPDEVARLQALGQLTGQDFASFLGPTSPNGQMFTTDKQGLGELSGNLSERDVQTVLPFGSALMGVSDWNGGPAPSLQALVQMAQTKGLTGDQIYSKAKTLNNPVLLDALKRMGWGPTPQAGPGDIIHASSTPGVF